MAKQVCVVGSVNMDLVVTAPRLPQQGETVLGERLELHPGGKGANQAVAASRLGAQVALVGAIGDDDWGARLRAVLTADGVDLHHLRTLERMPTGVALITLLPDGDNAIVVAPGANARLTAQCVEEAANAIRASDVLVLQGELPPAVNVRAAQIAHGTDTLVVLNAAPAEAIDDALLQLVDVLVVNESEARVLLDSRERDVSPAGLARRLASLGPERVLVTLGAQGALHFDGAELASFDAFDVDCVDATAAGDAFVAAIAVFRAEGMRTRDAVRAACAAGALATTERGAIPSLPKRDAVEALLAERG